MRLCGSVPRKEGGEAVSEITRVHSSNIWKGARQQHKNLDVQTT